MEQLLHAVLDSRQICSFQVERSAGQMVGVYSIGLLLIDVNYNQLFSVVFLYQRTLNVYVNKAYFAIQVPNSQT